MSRSPEAVAPTPRADSSTRAMSARLPKRSRPISARRSGEKVCTPMLIRSSEDGKVSERIRSSALSWCRK